ncbi:MAG: PaaI family thioesterase [Alphaproteobacteria bacterium]|nr:PaaI family thioesterase [Alphaproteobacteria bacterium]
MTAIADETPGLQAMRQLAASAGGMGGMGGLMGMTGGEAAPGLMIFHASAGPQHGNPIGITHGGFAATLLDSCMSCAVHTTLAAGETYVTTDLHVSFIKAITPATGTVTARGEVLSRGRRLATARGTLTDSAGRLLASGIVTCMIMAAP